MKNLIKKIIYIFADKLMRWSLKSVNEYLIEGIALKDLKRGDLLTRDNFKFIKENTIYEKNR